MRAARLAAATVFAFWLALAAALALDAALLGQAERAVLAYRADLTRVAQELRNPALNEQQLSEHRVVLETVRTGAIENSTRIAAEIAEVGQQIASLGPAPAEGRTEPAAVAATRAELQSSLDRLQSVKSQLDVVAVEAEQQSGRVGALQRDQFFRRIFDRNRSILNPMLWYDTGIGTGVLATRVAALVRNWWTDVSPAGNPLALLLIPAFIALFSAGYIFLRGRLTRWMNLRAAAQQPPDDIRRLWRIVRGLMTTVVAIAILVVPIELALEAGGYNTPRMLMLWNALNATVLGTIVYYMLVRRVAAPGHPAWRVVDLDDTAATRFTVLAGLAAFVAVFNTQLSNMADGLFLGVTYSIGQSALAALIMLLLLSLIMITLRNQDGLAEPAGRRVYFGWTAALAPLIWVAILVGFAALLLGYLSFANFIAQKLFRTGLLVGVLFLVHHLADAAVASSFDPHSGVGAYLRRITGLGERAIERLGLLFRTGVDLLLVLAGLPLLFVLWTVTWVDFGGLLNSAALGVTLGEVTLSPWSIAMVLLILAAGVVLTNLFNRWLDRRILVETRLDKGVQDSIRKGASYAGYIVAAGFALTAAGLDFSNLAIVAGALGVGIGFGLQSIFNNFVSGLILLAERPIRVGDWISLPSGEGLVKRINVRATEIETFDSCSIIVPNSLLITEPVKNWTHGDTMGRFMVALTVDQASDPEAVKALLINVARQHPKVLSNPEPSVTLARFGPTGLDFELRAYVADIFQAGGAASDIRFSLLAALREKHITIPHPVAVMQGPQR